MTRDEIISMAQQVAKEFDYLWCNNIPELERFAELVAARERETVLNEVLCGLRLTLARERDEARTALLAIELAAVSLADAQTIAREALAAAIRARAEKETT